MKVKGAFESLYCPFIIILLTNIFVPPIHGKIHPLHPMQIDGTETFRILQTKKTTSIIARRCTLTTRTYKVRKIFEDTVDHHRFVFYAIPGNMPELKDKDDNPLEGNDITNLLFESNYIGRAECDVGWIHKVEVKPMARNCGIATVLTELCMIDPTLKENRNENLVFDHLEAINSDQARGIQDEMRQNCLGGLMGLLMKPSEGLEAGFTYLSAAHRMGYQFMVVQFYAPQPTNPETPCDPRFKAYKTEDVRTLYDGNTGRIEDTDGGSEGSGFRAKWYFCTMTPTVHHQGSIWL